MVPTLFDKRGKAGLACTMILFGNSEILLDLVPNLGDFLVPLDLIFRKPGIDLVLPHDSVTNAVHVQEVPIGLAAVSLVGVNTWRKLFPLKAVGHHIGEVIGVMLGGSGNRGGQYETAFYVDGGMFLHSEDGFFVLHCPVGFKIPLEVGRLLCLFSLFPQLIEFVSAYGTTGRADNPGIHSQTGFDGKAQVLELLQQFAENLFQPLPADSVPETAENRMIR